jgi:hypothetical protein
MKKEYPDFLEFFEKQIRPFWKNNEDSKSTIFELYNPEMFFGTLVGYMLPPQTARKLIEDRSKMNGSGIYELLISMRDGADDWLFRNIDILELISKVSENLKFEKRENEIELIGRVYISPDEEAKLISSTTDKVQSKKIVKALAAINFRMYLNTVWDDLLNADNAKFVIVMYYMFHSMILYSSYGAMVDGFVLSSSRLKASVIRKDRRGIEEMIRLIISEEDGRKIKPTEMWRLIVRKLNISGPIQLPSNYAIEYQQAPKGSGPHPGQIVQTDPEENIDTLRIDAFRKFYSKLTSEGRI